MKKPRARRCNALAGIASGGADEQRQPDRLIAARIGNAGGVTIGLGDGEMFLASDMPAILDYTRRVIFLESRQMAVVLKDGLQDQSRSTAIGSKRPCTTSRTIRLRRPRANIATSCRRKSSSRRAR